MITYSKLFKILSDRGHTSRYWLQQNGIHPATISKLQKNERINTDTINKICFLLNCQPGDILEYVPTDSEIFNPSATEEIHTIAAFEGDTIITKTKKGDVDEAIRKIKEKQEE